MEPNEVVEQLPDWEQKHEGQKTFVKNASGSYIANLTTSLTVGKHGPIALTDYNLIESIQHFNRERIPERIVHAKGSGAHGVYKCTKNLSSLTVAPVFRKGQKTPIIARFSPVVLSRGSGDTARDIRGFAIRFYTEAGNWDLVGNNVPFFFVRDAALFPNLIHSTRIDPVTRGIDRTAEWDFFSLRPETLLAVLFLLSPKGTPDGYRHMDGFGVDTYSFINDEQKLVWVKFHFKTKQGIKNLSAKEAALLELKDPDYATKDLYNAIANGKFPSWTSYIQTMTQEKANEVMNRKQNPFDPFDPTKVWPEDEFPLEQVGEFELNKNPKNMFAEMEQLGFNPNNLIPGVGGSPDRVLQARFFAYQDAKRYRLGTNYQQIPVNRPYCTIRNYQRDGDLNEYKYSQGGAPNYYPNSFSGPKVNPEGRKGRPPSREVSGLIDYYDIRTDDADYKAARDYWKAMDEVTQNLTLENLVTSIGLVSSEEVRDRAVSQWTKVDEELGAGIEAGLKQKKQIVI